MEAGLGGGNGDVEQFGDLLGGQAVDVSEHDHDPLVAAGFAFMIATMYFADYSGNPTVAPFLAISTVFHASDKPMLTPSAIPVEVVTGVMLHLTFSIAFGIGFAVLVRLFLHSWPLVVSGALVCGTLLWVLNFEILGNTVFPFFSNPKGPNVTFQGNIHPFIYGLFLVPFFLKSALSAVPPEGDGPAGRGASE